MRNVTEIQRRLIERGYLAPLDENGKPNADGTFGTRSRDAYNRFLASQGRPPVNVVSMVQLNRDLFPEEQPAPKPPKPNPLQSIFTGLAMKAVLNHLKGLPMFANLTGHKTVITGIIMVISGAVSLLAPLIGLGDTAGFNALSPGEAWTALTTGFGLIFLRQGMANEVSSTK
jgi:hypothetical protein